MVKQKRMTQAARYRVIKEALAHYYSVAEDRIIQYKQVDKSYEITACVGITDEILKFKATSFGEACKVQMLGYYNFVADTSDEVYYEMKEEV